MGKSRMRTFIPRHGQNTSLHMYLLVRCLDNLIQLSIKLLSNYKSSDEDNAIEDDEYKSKSLKTLKEATIVVVVTVLTIKVEINISLKQILRIYLCLIRKRWIDNI